MNIVGAWLFFVLGLVLVWLLVALLAVLFSRRPKQVRMEFRDGTVTGYKILKRDGKKKRSPVYGSEWRNDQLTADREPSIDNTNGIYLAASPSQLKYPDATEMIVRSRGSGTIVFHQGGARVQRARIVEEL